MLGIGVAGPACSVAHKSIQLGELKEELMIAHRKAAMRNSLSTTTLISAFKGSGSYTQAVAAAMLTTGKVHAPVEDIVDVLSNDMALTQEIIPGWGNSFIKAMPDETLDPIWEIIDQLNPELHERIGGITHLLKNAGKNIYPNIGCATAAASICLGIPKELSPHLFLECRLPAWYDILKSELS